MRSNLIAVTIFLIVSGTCNAQNILQEIFSRKEAKNAVVGSAGTALVVSEANIAYERKLVSFEKREVSSLWLKGRYTRFTRRLNQDGASFIDLSAMALLGKRNSYTEISAGIGMFPAQSAVYPAGSVGYRYHRSRGGIILRTGVGFPEIFYVGFGYGF
ncbi:MAG: hypothetical protein P1P82_02335 [Bacteroidales bacterium]|nr:hypothetical protein [Bacteroidales bacterium]MDT8431115.1 hypothetical protein [Bacteroidales bacterium]